MNSNGKDVGGVGITGGDHWWGSLVGIIGGDHWWIAWREILHEKRPVFLIKFVAARMIPLLSFALLEGWPYKQNSVFSEIR